MSHRFEYESDPADNVRLIGVAGVALALFAAGILWAYAITADRGTSRLPLGENIPAEVRAPEVGIVLKTLYFADSRPSLVRDDQEKHLANFGWVDRPHGIIHLPIDVAMEQLLAQPAGAVKTP